MLSTSLRSPGGILTPSARLWHETIEGHRRSVREATVETTAALVAERGLRAATMSEIAEKTGMGRATLYRYFPDIETIVAAWHRPRITDHLAHLTTVRDRAGTPEDRLKAVLSAYADLQMQRALHERDQPHGRELTALLHEGTEVVDAQRDLHRMVRDLIEDAAVSGAIRDDVSPDELAGYCIHALDAAGEATTEQAVSRLVGLVVAAMRPES